MKKSLFLTLAASLVGASPLMAVDLYITGATAFRANCHDACKSLFDNAPVLGSTLFYGSTAQFGNGANNNGNPQWVMTGTVSNKISALGQTTLTIHGFFTGSIQGIQTVENTVPLPFLDASGNLTTNTPTIGFSDASSASTPYPATGNFSEEKCCVQPFVMCKSVVGGGMTNITGITWEQLRYAIPVGRIPLSAWSNKTNDHGTYVYLLERTKDSGTRRTQHAWELYGFNQSSTVYIWDATNNFFYLPTNSVPLVTAAQGSTSIATNVQVVGTGGPGVNGANLNWGFGYIGGGDIKTVLGINNSNNMSFANLSFADAKGIVGATNWSQVIPLNGVWPTAAGAGLHGNTGTNDFSPITEGMYPCWGYEVIVYPNVDPSSISGDQNLTAAQLGNQTVSGTILGVFNAQTLINGGSPLVGSIEKTIEDSKAAGASAIRLSDMVSSRASVGGTITP